jgi:hypothetical protein
MQAGGQRFSQRWVRKSCDTLHATLELLEVEYDLSKKGFWDFVTFFRLKIFHLYGSKMASKESCIFLSRDSYKDS